MRVDAALFVRRRAERSAVVEPAAPIPVAVPSLAFEGGRQRPHVLPPVRRPRRIAARIGDACEGVERGVQQPAKPDTLAATAFADAVHAIVPIAAADQRQAMAADRQAGVQRTGAMLVEAGGLVRDGRLEEAIALAWLQCLACQERD